MSKHRLSILFLVARLDVMVRNLTTAIGLLSIPLSHSSIQFLRQPNVVTPSLTNCRIHYLPTLNVLQPVYC